MSYPWTRVPASVPPIDGLQLRLLPAVDLVMGLLWSRPGGLSLRTTWVTPATIALGLMVGALAAIAGLAALVNGIEARNLLAIGGGVAALVVSGGAAGVAVYGIRQRLIR